MLYKFIGIRNNEETHYARYTSEELKKAVELWKLSREEIPVTLNFDMRKRIGKVLDVDWSEDKGLILTVSVDSGAFLKYEGTGCAMKYHQTPDGRATRIELDMFTFTNVPYPGYRIDETLLAEKKEDKWIQAWEIQFREKVKKCNVHVNDG